MCIAGLWNSREVPFWQKSWVLFLFIEDKEKSSKEIFNPLSVKAKDPFIQKKMGCTVDLETARQPLAAESEALAPRRRAPSRKGKGKNTNQMIKAISPNPKGKGKYTSPVKFKSQLEVHPLEGVAKKRRMVLKSVMLAKKAKKKFSSKHFHLDLEF